jgi:hypothetical protein
LSVRHAGLGLLLLLPACNDPPELQAVEVLPDAAAPALPRADGAARPPVPAGRDAGRSTEPTCSSWVSEKWLAARFGAGRWARSGPASTRAYRADCEWRMGRTDGVQAVVAFRVACGRNAHAFRGIAWPRSRDKYGHDVFEAGIGTRSAGREYVGVAGSRSVRLAFDSAAAEGCVARVITPLPRPRTVEVAARVEHRLGVAR